VPDQLLSILKYVFLALLYLFFLRVVRAVWSELREPKAVPVAAHPDPNASSDRGRRRETHLVVLEPASRKGEIFDLGDELTVGRAPACGVPLTEDTFVSQLHARLFRRDARIYVEDLGSTNGTYLNTKAVSAPAEIHKGDRLQIGKTILEVAK
jgi:pSer/pThr/pTyr-binding forkhead associated (FHA) protein